MFGQNVHIDEFIDWSSRAVLESSVRGHGGSVVDFQLSLDPKVPVFVIIPSLGRPTPL